MEQQDIVKYENLDAAAVFIGNYLAGYGRISVSQVKEKYGTVRVYCQFGIHSLYGLFNPFFHYYPRWMRHFISLDFFLAGIAAILFERVVVKWQKRVYKTAYAKAIAKWPEIKHEILVCADYSELLESL